MKGFQLEIKGNWGHFKRPETNNNPLSHDLITKTALIGMIGAVLGVEREDMKTLFPQLSEDLLYGVQLLNPVKKVSWGFTSRKANKPTEEGAPKHFEFLRNPYFLVSIALKNNRSETLFDSFCDYVKNGLAEYTPVLGWHNCPAEIRFVSQGFFSEPQNGEFETQGFVIAGYKPKDFNGKFRIGFDKIPTYQKDFWNVPDNYVNIIYPDCSNTIKVDGKFYEYSDGNIIKELCLI
jgi:CRISPR-associated protein Cas5 subtype I-B